MEYLAFYLPEISKTKGKREIIYHRIPTGENRTQKKLPAIYDKDCGTEQTMECNIFFDNERKDIKFNKIVCLHISFLSILCFLRSMKG